MAVSEQPELTVVVPAYNEAGTIEAVIERLRELPYALQIIVVDDCSDDGTAAIVERPRRRRARAPRAQPGQGRRAALRLRAGARPHRRDPGRRPRVRPGRHPRARRADPLGRRRRRLRLAPDRRAAAARAPVLAQGRQPRAVAAHERALQHDAVRHGDRLQGLHDRRAARDRAALRVGLPRSSPSSPRRSAAAASASTRCRSPTTGAPTTRARRSPGATGSRRCTRSSSTASGTGSACGARFAAVAGIVVSVVFGWLADPRARLRRGARRARPRRPAWILAAVGVSVLGVAMRASAGGRSSRASRARPPCRPSGPRRSACSPTTCCRCAPASSCACSRSAASPACGARTVLATVGVERVFDLAVIAVLQLTVASQLPDAPVAQRFTLLALAILAARRRGRGRARHRPGAPRRRRSACSACRSCARAAAC